MEEKKKMPWLVKALLWMGGLLAILMLLLLARSCYMVPRKLGAPPNGWMVMNGTNIERFSLMPYEARLIRCERIDDRFIHMDRVGSFVMYVQPTNTAELEKQTYNLEPDIIVDVPDDKPIWAEIRESASPKPDQMFSALKFHVHTNHIAAGIVSKNRTEPALEFSHR